MRTILIAAIAALALIAPPTRAAPNTPGEDAVEQAAIHDLCDRRVVILGEAGTHGDGHTLRFKIDLAQRLIDRCGFKAIVFESGYYEFDHLQRRLLAGDSITPGQVSAAIGGVWNLDAEMQPFIAALTERANRGKLVLAGMDDAWDMAGVPFTTDILPKELAARLAPPDGDRCARAFHKRIYFDYGEADYQAADRSELLECLARVRAATPASADRDRDIIDSLQGAIVGDLKPAANQRNDIERGMYRNLRRTMKRLPAGAKVIVWTATVHGAKRSATRDGADVRSMGGYVRDTFGGKAFVLAFGAVGGTYGVLGQTDIRKVPEPPPTSLEASAASTQKGPAVYFPAQKIRSLGTAPAALFYHQYATRRWSDAVDGVVIFSEEFPAARLAQAKE
jgi:erythromycin esterase-like protein